MMPVCLILKDIALLILIFSFSSEAACPGSKPLEIIRRATGNAGSDVYLYCPYSRDASWSFGSPPTPLSPRPGVTQENNILILTNVTKEDEGYYHCSGRSNIWGTIPSYFLYVEGHGYFKSCPESRNGENCAVGEHLEGKIGGSVGLDMRIGYRDGGSCNTKQSVYDLKLKKSGKEGFIYYCNHVYNKCSFNTDYDMLEKGSAMFDYQLILENLTTADSGEYQVTVRLQDSEGSTTRSITKNYNLTITTEDYKPTACGDSSDLGKRGSVMLLNGTVLTNNSDLSGLDVGQDGNALLCVTTNEDCCATSEFYDPSGRPIGEIQDDDDSIYVTRGRQIIRLNQAAAVGSVLEDGQYCCTLSSCGIQTTQCVKISSK